MSSKNGKSGTSFDGFSLTYLEPVAIAYLDYVETLGRPLLQSERKSGRWILVAFESPIVKRECARMPEEKLRYYSNLMGGIREAILPDPAKRLRFSRNLDGTKAKTTRGISKKPGEHSLDLAPFAGVRMGELNAGEIVERIEMLARSCAGIAVLTQDLGANKKARQQGKNLRRMARQVVTLGKAMVVEFYTARQKEQPRDLREEDPDLEKMEAELAEMAALKAVATGGGGAGGVKDTRL